MDLDFYFVPDGDESPSFINVKFNARRVDHEFVEIAAGIRQAHLWSAAEFKLWNDVSWAHEAQLRAQKLNQSMPREPEFADDAILASAFEKSNLEPGSATREFPQMMEDIHLALSPALFANPSLNLPVQFRITYERLDWQNPGQTVRYRRFFEGGTELKSLTPDELTRLTSLIQLSKCQSMLGPRGS